MHILPVYQLAREYLYGWLLAMRARVWTACLSLSSSKPTAGIVLRGFSHGACMLRVFGSDSRGYLPSSLLPPPSPTWFLVEGV